MSERDATMQSRSGPTRLPTIRDVARVAGVGKTTVSDALRGRGEIAPATRERVLLVAKQLGYHAHLGARSLTRQQTEVIGVMVGDFFDPFIGELTGRLEQHAAARGFRMLLSTAGPDLREEESAVVSLLEHRVAAVILVGFTGDPQVLETIGTHIPVVYMGYASQSGVSIGMDEKLGGDLATAHLIGLGHKRIAYLSAALLPRHVDRDRLHGYRRALRRGGLSSAKDLVLRVGPTSEEQRLEMIRRLLSQSQRPTAVFAASDITAIEVMSCAYELKLQVPGDLSIVGYDDIMLARTPMIALSTIAQPAAELASRAIDTAVALMDDPDARPQSTLIEPRLIVRKTTAPPP